MATHFLFDAIQGVPLHVKTNTYFSISKLISIDTLFFNNTSGNWPVIIVI